MKIDRPPRVALVIETSTSFGRRLLCGIAAHIRENSPWSVFFGERGVFDPVPDWLKDWRGDGIITRTASPVIREVIAANRIPAVDLNEQLAGLNVPMVTIDHAAVGREAAKHLLERGFTRFAYLGDVGQVWSDRRGDAFTQAVGDAGFHCDRFCGTPEDLRSLRQGAWELQLDGIASWVGQLPKPVGIMACHDFRAVQLLAACRLADVAVPEEAAVIGVGADDVACELADPPLSSVVLNAWRMGYEAAALLDRLMRGGTSASTELRIPPIDVATRQSTDVTAIADPVVARAMRFIREQACTGINVEDVLAHVDMSRTALQDHFRQVLGKSIHDVLIEAKIARVRALLAETSLPIDTIAERTGFKYPEYMSSILKQRTGWTPARYRKEYGRKDALLSRDAR